jgi:hypothetical protein
MTTTRIPPKPTLPLSGALSQKLGQLELASELSAPDEVRSLKLSRAELAPSVHNLFQASEAKALNFTRGLIATWRDDTQAEEDSEPLLDWARGAGRPQRMMMVRAFQQQRRGVLVVHHMGGMSRDDARSFMKDYFDAGGSLEDVAEWFQQAGHVLRTERPAKAGTDGLFSKAWNWVKGAVTTVSDALKAAGKSLGDAIGKVVSWSASKIADFVDGLLEAGRKVGEILREALAKGRDALLKFVRAVLEAGRKVGEVLVAFMKDQLSTIRMVLEGLLAAGVQLAEAITGIVTHVAEQFRKGFFQGLIALGKSPFLIMKEALKATGAVAALAFATLLDVLGGHRPLTAEEKRQASRVFGISIDLERVKVASASLPADLVNLVNGQRPFTTMYVLNFASWKEVNVKTLIHELTHTWQGVIAGPVYMLEAIHAQTLGEGYTVTNDILRARGNQLSNFNREQQAVIVEEYWFEKWGKNEYPNLQGDGLDVALLEPYARKVFKAPRTAPVPPPRLPTPVRVVDSSDILDGSGRTLIK